jgi:hypothetical protein
VLADAGGDASASDLIPELEDANGFAALCLHGLTRIPMKFDHLPPR